MIHVVEVRVVPSETYSGLRVPATNYHKWLYDDYSGQLASCVIETIFTYGISVFFVATEDHLYTENNIQHYTA